MSISKPIAVARGYVHYFQLLIGQSEVMRPSPGTQTTKELGGGAGVSSKENRGDGTLEEEEVGFKQVKIAS